MAKAIQSCSKKNGLSATRAAVKFGVSKSTLLRRLRGGKTRSVSHQHQQLLTAAEEKALCNWISRLNDRGFPPRVANVPEFAAWILKQRKRGPPIPAVLPGRSWARRFFLRHPELLRKWSRRISKERADNAEDNALLEAWFEAYEAAVRTNGIAEANIWNMDETGFAMGPARNAKVVLTARNAEGKARMPGNRDWVTAVECVSAAGRHLDPLVIFKGSRILQNWIPAGPEALEATRSWSLACSAKAFTDNDLAMRWLTGVFDPATRQHPAAPRLLVIDGHGSHTAPAFQEYCEQAGIVCVCLPPHTSHVTQPLDVGCFSPLKQYYGQQLDRHAQRLDHHITKQHFLEIYAQARAQTFQPRTIRGGFKGAGLVPFHPARVLQAKARPKTPQSPVPEADAAPTEESLTPMTPERLEKAAAKLLLESTPSTTLRRVQRIARGAETIATTNRLIQQDCAVLEAEYRKRRTGIRGQGPIRGLGRMASIAEANYRLGGGLG